MVVYLDILILENFLVNMFLLTVTMQSVRRKVPLKNMVIAALVGSIYVITLVYPRLNFMSKTPFKFIVAILMIILALGQIKDFNLVLKGVIIFIMYSFIIAGLSVYLSISSGDSVIPTANLYDFSYKKLVISVMIIYVAVVRAVIYIRDRKILKKYIFKVDIYMNDKEATIVSLLDTGNELCEPVTNLPVMIVEKSVFDKFDISGDSFYSIPYSAVGSIGNKLQGIKPNKVVIRNDQYSEEKNLIVAFTTIKLSKHGEYQGLLPRGVVE